MLNLILGSVLAYRLLRISRAHKEIMGESFKEGSGSVSDSVSGKRRELNAAFVILVMAAVPLTLYVPNALFWVPYSLNMFIAIMNSEIIMLLAVLGKASISLCIVVHLWNLYLYWFRIPGFRAELVRLMTCGRVVNFGTRVFVASAMASLSER